MTAGTKNLTFDVVLPHRCLLGEGPVWDALSASILWVDILKGEIHEFALSSGVHKVLEVHEMVGAIALCKGEGLIAALKSGQAIVDRETAQIKPLFNPEVHMPENRFNDGKCDPEGRFWIGTMSLSERPGAGSLYKVEKDLSCSVQLQNATIANGMAWSTDNKTFYHIDTPTHRVTAYDYDLADGNISNGRLALDIPEHDGAPDGMTIDSEGMLWIAHWGGWQVTRWDPLSGNKLLSIPVPVAQITSCTFGGETLQDLYITSASNGLTEEQRGNQPLAGSLFVVKDCGFQGMSTVAFDSTLL